MPLPEQTRLELDAIDAALAGESVDPQLAELAELALLLADSRPELPPSRAAELDRRFMALSLRHAELSARRPWFLRPAFAAALAVPLILVVLVIVLPRGGGGSISGSTKAANGSSAVSSAGVSSQSGVSSSSGASSSSGGSSSPSRSAGSQALSPAPAPALTVPTPQSNGRRIVQTSQLSLGAPSSRLGAVSQELFDAVGAEQGIVKHSAVTTGSGGYASFTLSIPTQNLSATLARLTRLRYATVASSTASTTDVNSQYLDDQRKLADARALRSSLLTQLQAATTTTAVDSLKTQIGDAEATITKDEAMLNGLQSRISYSAVNVTISAAGSIAPVTRRNGFTLRRATHDALGVLRVSAGVALIVLAVLIPLGLLAAVGVWVTLGWRRHRRERALDAT